MRVSPALEVPDAELEFSFARSGGPGGQNVNKVNSKALLRWRLQESRIPEAVKSRFRQAFGSRLTREDEVLISSDRFRDQAKNAEDCREKLAAMLKLVEAEPKRRKKTKPTRSSKERRLSTKRVRSELKKGRGRWSD